MKIIIVLVFICSTYAIDSEVVPKPTHLSEKTKQHIEQHIEQVINHHIANKEKLKPTVKVQHVNDVVSDPSKVTVEIPSHIHQVVTQVSQHIPVVVNQALAKKRLVRSPSHGRSYSQSVVTQAQYHVGNHHGESMAPKKCDYKCTDMDMPVCGYNGRCYREFESQCALSKNNCLTPLKTFILVDDYMCQDTTTTKCYQGDM